MLTAVAEGAIGVGGWIGVGGGGRNGFCIGIGNGFGGTGFGCSGFGNGVGSGALSS